MPITPADFCIEEKGKPLIDKVVLDYYCTQEGFRCMFESSNLRDICVVRIVDKRVYNSSTHSMYHYVRDMLKKNHAKWLKPLKEYTSFLFAPTIIQMMRIEPDLLRDTATESFIPFINGIVSVTKENITLKTYSQVLLGETCIMNDRIIPRKIDLSKNDFKKGVWYKFCENAVGKDGIGYLMRSLGYLLHTYKDKANAKMIMFSDTSNVTNKDAMGGSGKSIIAYDSIKEIRNVHWEDGKEFEPNGRFKFQGITSSHDVICIDDIPKGFRQEVIYNKVTGNFSSEEKFKSRQTFSFDNSFKTILTGNYGLVITGGSDSRRTCLIGFTNHYNEKHQPIHEFGDRFFSEWVGESAIEYQYFYCFMFECIRMYLNQGIESYKYNEIVTKGLYNGLSKSQMERLNGVIDRIVGEENCMRINEFELLSGIPIESLKSIMLNKGCEIKQTRLRTKRNPDRNLRYYFDTI